ncbi:YjdF family protein [Paenibacillus sp. JX-17]|uniref:YjdF family protein n=1 Tax=Paenibacillus lacisoli TaxID=3064525 RepID=A0ABT9CH87_9BACL|nr:YjdF family protein [Paenibacillus sp. JX-17]MDO7908639.1 YjdF family protein [Paenibacillus sp. JX-17]
MKLTVYHDGQYWVGIVEIEDQGRLRAGRFLFGSEPRDQEILDFIAFRLGEVMDNMSEHVDSAGSEMHRRINPKRLARQVARELEQMGITSLAQEALKLEYAHRKKEKQTTFREQREAYKERKRELRLQKAKAKHRGK